MSKQLKIRLMGPLVWFFIAGVWWAHGYGWMSVLVIAVNLGYAWFLVRREDADNREARRG